MNGNATHLASGSYNSMFRVLGCYNGSDTSLEASRDPMRKRLQTPPPKVRRSACSTPAPRVAVIVQCVQALSARSTGLPVQTLASHVLTS